MAVSEIQCRRFILFLIMAQNKKNTFSADQYGSAAARKAPEEKQTFYFGKENFKWMLIGLGLVALGFLLMLGPGANTRPDGVIDPNYWNDGVFSIRRVRIAPLLVIAGFAVEVYAILKVKK